MSDSAFRSTGPRSLGAIVPGIARPALARATSATARLAADWPLIVGPRIAAISQPTRLANGTLTLLCPGPAALELQHIADALLARVNAHLGGARATRLRLAQGPLPGAESLPHPPRPRPTPNPAAHAARLRDFPDGPVRDALLALAAALDTGPA